MADTSQGKLQSPRVLREKLTSWDAKASPKAPLSDMQKDILMDLTTYSSNRALPADVSDNLGFKINSHKIFW